MYTCFIFYFKSILALIRCHWIGIFCRIVRFLRLLTAGPADGAFWYFLAVRSHWASTHHTPRAIWVRTHHIWPWRPATAPPHCSTCTTGSHLTPVRPNFHFRGRCGFQIIYHFPKCFHMCARLFPVCRVLASGQPFPNVLKFSLAQRSSDTDVSLWWCLVIISLNYSSSMWLDRPDSMFKMRDGATEVGPRWSVTPCAFLKLLPPLQPMSVRTKPLRRRGNTRVVGGLVGERHFPPRQAPTHDKLQLESGWYLRSKFTLWHQD